MRELTTNEVDQVSGGSGLPGGQSPLDAFADFSPLANAGLNVLTTGLGFIFPGTALTTAVSVASKLPPIMGEWFDQLGNKHTFNPPGPTITDQLGNQHSHSTYDPNANNVFGRF